VLSPCIYSDQSTEDRFNEIHMHDIIDTAIAAGTA
jgi:hypothetical protein